MPSRPQGGEGEEEEEEKGEGCGGLVLPSNADIAANSKGLGSEPVRVHVCVSIYSCGCVREYVCMLLPEHPQMVCRPDSAVGAFLFELAGVRGDCQGYLPCSGPVFPGR